MKDNNLDACLIEFSEFVLNDVKYYPSSGRLLIKVTNLQVRSFLRAASERNIYSGGDESDLQGELTHFTMLTGDGYLEGADISLAGTFESYRKLSVYIELYDSKLIEDKIAWKSKYEGVDSSTEEKVKVIKQVLERVNAEIVIHGGSLACYIYLTDKEIEHTLKLVREGRTKELVISLNCYPMYTKSKYQDSYKDSKYLRPEGLAFGRVDGVSMKEDSVNDDHHQKPEVIDEELFGETIETNSELKNKQLLPVDRLKEIVNPVTSELKILNVLLDKLQKTVFWLVVIVALILVFLKL